LLAILMTLAATVAACSSSGSAPTASGSAASASGSAAASSGSSATYNIAYIGTKTVTFQDATFAGLQSVPGVKATFIEVGFDVTKQAEAIQNAVASGKYKGIVLDPDSATGVVAAVNQAIKAGIQVYNVDSPMGPDPYSLKPQIKGQAGAVVGDYTLFGKSAAQLAIQACNAVKASPPCEIARIGGLPQFAVETEQQNGSSAVIKAAGSNYQMLPTIYAGGYDANSGLKAAQNLLAAHPGVKVIFASDPVIKGVQQVVKGKGIQLIGIAGTQYAYQQVANGGYYGEVASFPVYEGMVAGESIVKHIQNPNLPADNPSAVEPGLPLAATKANLGSFRGQYE
jgi:ABC-type sugar transport system substrate-binding protein